MYMSRSSNRSAHTHRASATSSTRVTVASVKTRNGGLAKRTSSRSRSPAATPAGATILAPPAQMFTVVAANAASSPSPASRRVTPTGNSAITRRNALRSVCMAGQSNWCSSRGPGEPKMPP